MQDLFEEIGLERERVRMVNVSSAMAGQFIEAANEMTADIAELGSNPLRTTKMTEKGKINKNGN